MFAYLTVFVSHDEVGALMNLSSGDGPLELQSTSVASVVLGESEFFALVANLSTARKGTILVCTTVSGF